MHTSHAHSTSTHSTTVKVESEPLSSLSPKSVSKQVRKSRKAAVQSSESTSGNLSEANIRDAFDSVSLSTTSEITETLASSVHSKARPAQHIHNLLTAEHRAELTALWDIDPRVPSVTSRQAWAHAHSVIPAAVHTWFYRTRKRAIARGLLVGQGTYGSNLDVLEETMKTEKLISEAGVNETDGYGGESDSTTVKLEEDMVSTISVPRVKAPRKRTLEIRDGEGRSKIPKRKRAISSASSQADAPPSPAPTFDPQSNASMTSMHQPTSFRCISPHSPPHAPLIAPSSIEQLHVSVDSASQALHATNATIVSGASVNSIEPTFTFNHPLEVSMFNPFDLSVNPDFSDLRAS
jgi:hypothetical protein